MVVSEFVIRILKMAEADDQLREALVFHGVQVKCLTCFCHSFEF